MHSTRHDPTVAALHASTGLPGYVVDVVVLTDEVGLLATLRAASGQEHAIWHAPAAETAVDLLVGGRCGILIADLESLRGDVTLLEQLQRQFPELVLLATGRRDEEHTVAPLVTSGRIYRFLHKPVSPARAKLFLGTATRRYNELRNLAAAPAPSAAPVEFGSGWLKLAGIAAVVLAALVTGWWVTRLAPQATRESIVPPPSSAISKDQQVADLLGHALMAYAADRLSEPRGNNALQYFRSALALDPRSADAQAGVDRVLRTLEARVTEALAARNAERGAATLTALQRAAPDHPRLDTLRAQLLAISRARPQSTAAAPPRPVAAPRAAQAATEGDSNIATARARIRSVELTEPDGDAAIDHLRRARAAGENDSKLRIAATDAGSKALNAAETALAAGDASQAQRWLAAAQLFDSEFELTLPRVDKVAAQLSALTATREVIERDLAAAIRLRERGQLVDPTGDNAYERVVSLRERAPASAQVQEEQQRLASAMLDRSRTALAAGNLDEAETFLQRASALAPETSSMRALQEELASARSASDFMKHVVPATSLSLQRSVPPRYPSAGERNHVEGYVDVEFTVGVDGTTRDLVVKAARPANVFDKAALDAVSQWRFAPVMKGGAPVPQRAAVRVRFELK